MPNNTLPKYTEMSAAEQRRLFGDYKPFAAGGLDVRDIFGLEEESWEAADSVARNGAARASAARASAANPEPAPGHPENARMHWAHVRHCQRMKHALADRKWSVVLQALHENTDALRKEQIELQAAKAQLGALHFFGRF